jgi:hypothetical protein
LPGFCHAPQGYRQIEVMRATARVAARGNLASAFTAR